MSTQPEEQIWISENTPFVSPRMRGQDAGEFVLKDCVLDTGCALDMIISPSLAESIAGADNFYSSDIALANGNLVPAKWFRGQVHWLGLERSVAITIMDPCPAPLLGLPLLKNTLVSLGDKSGRVRPLSGTA